MRSNLQLVSPAQLLAQLEDLLLDISPWRHCHPSESYLAAYRALSLAVDAAADAAADADECARDDLDAAADRKVAL